MPMYLNQASVYDLQCMCVNWGVNNTIATCFSQFNNNYIRICVNSLLNFHIYMQNETGKGNIYTLLTNETEQKKANIIQFYLKQ